MAVARIGKALLGTIAALLFVVIAGALVLKLIDWNAHRDVVIRLVERYTDYEIERLDRLDIGLYFPLRIHLENFVITQDLPDSALRSVAGETLDVAIAPLSLLTGRLRIHSIETDGLRVDMQAAEQPPVSDEVPVIPLLEAARIADAEMVYRMADPEAEPYHVRIDQLTLTSSEADEALTLAGSGELLGLPFRLDGDLAPIDQFMAGDGPAPLRIVAEVAGDDLSLDGGAVLSGPETYFEGEVAAAGDHLAELIRPFREVASLPPYSLRTQLHLGNLRMAVTDMQARLGESELNGEASVELGEGMPHVRADLESPRIRHQDYAPLIPVEAVIEPEEKEEVFAREPLDSSGLWRLDADVELNLGRYEGNQAAELFTDMAVKAKLREGTLIINPFKATIGEGEVGGAMTIASRDDATELAGKLSASGIDMPALITPHLDQGNAADYINGRLFATAEFTTAGVSPYDWVRAMDGGAAVALTDGSISQLLVEALGLHVTGAVVAWLKDNPLIEIYCALGVVGIDQGVLQTKRFLLATPTSNVVANGTVDFHKERVDFELQSFTKGVNVLAAGSPISIEGSLDDIGVDLLSGELAARLGGSVLLAAVTPALALLPVSDGGDTGPGRCRTVESELGSIEEVSRGRVDEQGGER